MSANHNITVAEEFRASLTEDVFTFHKIMDTFHLEFTEGWALPDWLTPKLDKKLRWLDAEFFNIMCLTKRFNQINAGPVFYDIADKIKQLLKQESSGYDFTKVNVGASANKKLTLYSATDIVMNNLLVGMQAFDPIHHLVPQPAATVRKFYFSKLTRRLTFICNRLSLSCIKRLTKPIVVGTNLPTSQCSISMKRFIRSRPARTSY